MMTSVITTDAVHSRTRPKIVYAIPHLSADATEHFAHLPAFLEVLGERTDLVALVERGTPPGKLPGVRMVVSAVGRTRLTRLLNCVRAIRACHRAGYRTYFLRYSRLLLIVLVLTYPLFRPRIFLWRSGTADLIEPGHSKTVRQRLDDGLNYVLARCVHAFVTGPETMVPIMRGRWRLPPGRMRLLYNDIDSDRFTPPDPVRRSEVRRRHGWNDGDFVILFVHRLSFRRGTRLLARFLDSVDAALPCRVRLVVVGDGPDRHYLDRMAAGRPNMHVLGAVPNVDLPDLYGAADCFLMPSYEEGFPRVLLEAMSSALPIVTTRAGGSVDVVGRDYPFVCAVGDLSGLVAGVVELAGLPRAERDALGDRLRDRARDRFSPQRVARMLEDLL
ncbi:Glycosyltransferase involved in cell wall bisynthesis [Streptosporangium canum]|uniref:Glycosyltransferase involved in cell wall bisynthesis n=1 Tax=Streptosporangium canum TaxID=324952 RepID=A0A1I3XWU8_9ACTN|nr:Glycosyltransferase involved in cell wall bisynthesis [Streptosporangium canum]